MTFTGGSLTGDGTLRVTGNGATCTWIGTLMNGTGNVIVDTNATLILQTGFTDSGFTITNNWLTRWVDGNIALNNGAVIINQPTDLFQVEMKTAVMYNTAGTATFNNYGTFRKIQGAGQPWGSTEIQIPFNSVTVRGQPTSMVDAQFGSIGLRGTDTIQGNVNAATDAQVEFGAVNEVVILLDGTTFTGTGTVRVTAAGELAIAGNAQVTNSGTFELGGFDPRLEPSDIHGFLVGPGTFWNNGTSEFTAGSLTNVTEFRNYAQLVLQSEGGNNNVQISSSVLRNYAQGTITWTGEGVLLGGGGEIDNLGAFTVISVADLVQGAQAPLGFINEPSGSFVVGAGDAVNFDVPFTTSGIVVLGGQADTFSQGVTQNSGITSIDNGSLNTTFYRLTAGILDLGNNQQGILWVTDTLTISQGAYFTGIGEVIGSVTNGGTINLGGFGAPLGDLTITLNYTQTATGTLRMRILSPQNLQYDGFFVRGTANLAGTLQVIALAGFNPANGDKFAILSFGQAVGNFVTPYSLPALPGQLSWSVSFGSTGLTLTAKQ